MRKKKDPQSKKQRPDASHDSDNAPLKTTGDAGIWPGSSYFRRLDFLNIFNTTRRKRSGKAREQEGAIASLLKKLTTALTLIVLVLVATALIVDVSSGNQVVINPLLMSPELQYKLGEELTARRLRDGVLLMISQAKSVKQSQDFDLPPMTSLPDMQVPATGISVKTLRKYLRASPLRYAKNFFGINPIEVNGQAWIENGKVMIELNITKDVPDGPPQPPKQVSGDLNNFEPAIMETSEHILAYAEPYLCATYLYRTKQTDKAQEMVNKYVNRGSVNEGRMWLILSGLMLMDQGKYDDAIARFTTVTQDATAGGKRQRELAAAYNDWGLALLYECKPEEAIAKFRESIDCGSQFAGAYSNYGKALMDTGKPDEALLMLRRALDLEGDRSRAHFNLGQIVADRNPREAVNEFKKAIDEDPNYAEAYSSWGEVLVDKFSEQTAEAFVTLNRAIELNKEFAPAYINRALNWANECNFKKAIEDGEKAVELYPRMTTERQGCEDYKARLSRAYNNLGWFYEEDKKYEYAVANYQKAIDLDPKYHYAYTGEADAFRKWGGSHIKEAKALYEWVLNQPDANKQSRDAAQDGLEALKQPKDGKQTNAGCE